MENKNNPCAICGETSPENFRIWFDGFVKLYRCLKCGFIAQYPGPGRNTVIIDYEDCYSLNFLNAGQEFMYPDRRRVLKDIANRISIIKPKGILLDVGCGDGQFLYLCNQMGFECFGVEDSRLLSDYAQKKTTAQVVQGIYCKEMYPANSFDVITFIQVLEHIPFPADVLIAADFHLRQGGIIVIEVPSVHSPHFLVYHYTRIKKFVKPPNGVILSHYGYYDPNSLLTLTTNCGFTNLSLTTGRWQYKYNGLLGLTGKMIDPLLNRLRVGGILYIGMKR